MQFIECVLEGAREVQAPLVIPVEPIKVLVHSLASSVQVGNQRTLLVRGGAANLDLALVQHVQLRSPGDSGTEGEHGFEHRYKLERAAGLGGDKAGIFTLVMRKSAAGWRIIHDHTSATN